MQEDWHQKLDFGREVERRLKRSIPSATGDSDALAADSIAAIDQRLAAFLNTDLGQTITLAELGAMVEFVGLSGFISRGVSDKPAGRPGVASWGWALWIVRELEREAQRPDEQPANRAIHARRVREAIVQAGCFDELDTFDANAALDRELELVT